jgi:hypothetical protein
MTDNLVEHIRTLQVGMGFSDEIVARNIRANPKAHIDALVEDGVLKWYSDPPFGVPLLTVVQPEPPRCTAWVEIGNGRQICTRESGHKGVHSSGTSGVTNWNRPDVLWETGP